jgi:type I restriction enzyme S subunit
LNNSGIVCSLKKDIDKKFLYYGLKTVPRKSFVSGSAQPQVVIQDLEKIEFLVPESKPEQTHIAEILSTADEAIAHTEALIAKYQRIKTGLMQDLLTKGIDENGNIRSKATHKFVVKNGIDVPEEWEVDIIDDVSKVTKLAGYEFTKYFDYSIGGEIIALRALNIKNEEIILDDIQTIPKKVSDQLPRSKINKGDVLITYIGAYIGDTLLITESNKYHLAPNIAKLTAGNKLTPEFLEIVLKTYPVQKQTKNLTAVTATPSLTMGQIRNIFISFPKEIDEQKRIITTINSMRQNIKDEQNKLHKLQSLKTGLMQDLLSGRVRVDSEELIVNSEELKVKIICK